MRNPRRWLFALVLLLTLGAFGVASAQEGGDPERGGQLYVDNCAVCHGEDGRGRVGASLQAFPGIDVDAALQQTISEGVEGSPMPAWSEERGGPLSQSDIDDIVAYITTSFAGEDPIAPVPTYQPAAIEPLPDVAGDPGAGSAVYQQNCVMCHGEDGRGRFGAPLAKSWPGVEPAVYIDQVVSEGIAGTAMPAWASEEGGPLAPDQVEDVTAYVLSLAPPPAAPTPEPPPPGPLNATTTLVALGLLVLIGLISLVLYYRRA